MIAEKIFVALKSDCKSSYSFQIFCMIWSLMCNTTYFFTALKIHFFSLVETCALVQEALLLAQALFNGHRSEFQDGQLDFVAIFWSFVRALCFNQYNYSSILRWSFPGESKDTRFLEGKGSEKQIPEKRLLSHLIKIPSERNCLEQLLE